MMERYRIFVGKQWFVVCLISFFFWSVANATPSYLQLPKVAKVQEYCDDRDAEITTALLATIGDCQFSQVGVNFPTERHYLTCVTFQIKKFIKIENKECRDFIAPFVRDTLHQNLKLKMETINLNPINDEGTKEQLVSAFKYFHYWATQTQKTIYSVKSGYVSFENPESLYQQDIHQVLYSYWNKVWEAIQSTQPLMQADQNYSRGIEVLTQTLEIANELKLKPEVAFPLIEQILAHFEKRITLFTQLAQFSCELLNCNTPLGRNTEIVHISQSMAELAQKDPALDVMQESLAQLTDQKLKSFLMSFVEVAHSYHPHLFPEPEDKRTIYELQEEKIPQTARGYLTLLRMLASQAQSFLSRISGQAQFIPTLEIGLTPANIAELPQKVARLRSSLEKALEDFRNSQNRAAYQQTTQNQNQVQKLQLEEQLRSEEENLKNLIHDQDGLRAKLMDEESMKHQRTRSFFQILNSENWRKNQAQHLLQSAEGRLRIDGVGRLDTSNKSAQSLEQLEVPDTAIKVKAGQVVQFLVSGSWSPSCAIEKEGYPSASMTGPEGYTRQENHGKSQVSSVSSSLSNRSFDLTQNIEGTDTRDFNRRAYTETSQLVDDKIEVKVSSRNSLRRRFSRLPNEDENEDKVLSSIERFNSRPNPFTGTYSRSGSFQMMSSSDRSRGVEETKVSSDQTSKGKETSTLTQTQTDKRQETASSASFALGLRSRFTPYQNLPAGALILVQTQGDQVIDLEVVRPNTVKLIHEYSELHFVVNDCQGALIRKEDNHLVLQYSVKETSDTRLRRLIDHLQRTIEGLYQASETFLASGDLTPIQVRELEGRARAEISEIGYDLREVPLFHDLFEFWVANAIHQIELRVKILQAERRIAPSIRQLTLIQSELVNIEKQIGISYLTQVWNSNHFDLMNLGQSLRHVAQDLDSQVLPILQIRYPEVIEQLGYEHGQFLDAFHLGSSLEEMNRRFQAVLTTLVQKLEEVKARSNFLNATIVMRFPRDREMACEPGEGFCPIANPLTSEGVWSAFESATIPLESLETPDLRFQNTFNSIAVIPIFPEEVYVNEGQQDPVTGLFNRASVLSGALGNTAIAPVVQSMGLYFKLDQLEETSKLPNDAELRTRIKLGSESFFPLKSPEQGQRFYIPSSWSDFPLPIFFGQDPAPIGLFKRLGLHQEHCGIGISPFSQFQIDFRKLALDRDPLRKVIPYVKEMMLVLHVNYRNADLSLRAEARRR